MRKIWRALAAAAENGNVQAARLLTEYLYGTPQPELPPPVDFGPIINLPPLGPVPLGPDGIAMERDESPEASPWPGD